MAILRSNEIRDMSIEEMEAELAELRSELARERSVAAAGGSLENPGRVREIRRTIARILTIMKEERKKREVDRT
ncbi:50S ribosomal protein L29 [candidate division MSBL1 archaeon SCGC-AAA259I09]|uniref:Large ribosomal subunit protein uL29 n=2 Tax=candidate division MSBL1 TaxID=215777 RepID=A0A133UQK6_9EURY|nr:50S ribosomal protein L29 [candidate division MSBL1 archaeon SCGC-AAA259D14]KXA96511.1 50S ribosomal protein L29 [candidate division MSBL1 archaeon SCGC-AAA259I09]